MTDRELSLLVRDLWDALDTIMAEKVSRAAAAERRASR